MSYKTILVPIDGSKESKIAVEEAVKIAQKNGAMVIILHVVPERADLIEVYRIHSLHSAFREEGEKLLNEVYEYVSKQGVKVVTRLKEGNPWEEIVKAAQLQHCDLIIMGSHGHGTISKFLLGSVTQRVIGATPCPVMVVKEKD